MAIEKYFIKDHESITNTGVREKYGKLSGLVGICLNVFLCAIKMFCGIAFSSVSIVADAVNNLSDAMSSIVTLVGFKLANKPADEGHPYGHQRIEYISGLIVSFIILTIGLQLIKSSFTKIIHPTDTVFSILTVTVLLVSIVVKIILFFFNKRIGNKINSGVIKATAQDSLNDVITTSAVLISAVLSVAIGYNLDGFIGILVSLFIMYSGVNLIKETLNPLLGSAPDNKLVNTIEEKIKSYDGVMGIHDLMVHNYGPQRCFASVHVEVDAKTDVCISHDIIDTIERDFLEELDIHLIIHMDPIVFDNEKINLVKTFVKNIIKSIDPMLSMHDFRMVVSAHSKLIFDVTVPPKYNMTDTKIRDEIKSYIREYDASYLCVITIDRNYISSTK